MLLFFITIATILLIIVKEIHGSSNNNSDCNSCSEVMIVAVARVVSASRSFDPPSAFASRATEEKDALPASQEARGPGGM